MKKLFAGVVLASLLTGCATIFEGGTQPVTIRSVPDVANITVTNRAGEKIHSGNTPATVTLKRGAGYFKSEIYQVSISKDGFQPKTMTIRGSVNGWYIANVVFGGLIGLLIVDPATGAMYDLAPDATQATLDALGANGRKADGSLTIMLADDVPADVWKHTRQFAAN